MKPGGLALESHIIPQIPMDMNLFLGFQSWRYWDCFQATELGELEVRKKKYPCFVPVMEDYGFA